jgi:hypothetical protein
MSRSFQLSNLEMPHILQKIVVGRSGLEQKYYLGA